MDEQWIINMAQKEAERKGAFMSIVIAAAPEEDDETYACGLASWPDYDRGRRIPGRAVNILTLISSVYDHFINGSSQFPFIHGDAQPESIDIPWLGDHQALSDVRKGVAMSFTAEPVGHRGAFETSLGVYMSDDTLNSGFAGNLAPLFESIIHVVRLFNRDDPRLSYVQNLLAEEPNTME